MTREKIATVSSQIARADVARFEFFRHDSSEHRQAGVWLVRQGQLYFSLPITTGTKPGVADYLPAPHGLPGFANPVEQVYPSMTPFIELADGRILVATDGADEIEPGANSRSLRVVWRRWALVGGKPGQLIDPHITAEVVWSFDGTTLRRDETLTATETITLNRWWVALPSTASHSEMSFAEGQRWDRLRGKEAELSVAVKADWPLTVSLLATGDSALGRGAREPIPLHLVYETKNLRLELRKAAHWQMTLRVEPR
jgi:hypothetical protein